MSARKVNAQIYGWNKQLMEFFKATGHAAHSDLILIGKTFEK